MRAYSRVARLLPWPRLGALGVGAARCLQGDKVQLASVQRSGPVGPLRSGVLVALEVLAGAPKITLELGWGFGAGSHTVEDPLVVST